MAVDTFVKFVVATLHPLPAVLGRAVRIMDLLLNLLPSNLRFQGSLIDMVIETLEQGFGDAALHGSIGEHYVFVFGIFLGLSCVASKGCARGNLQEADRPVEPSKREKILRAGIAFKTRGKKDPSWTW